MIEYTFPPGFLWGTATAAHQVEGNNTSNDMWVMEHVEHTMFQEPSGDACDHFHRYPSDIALLAALGFNTYRFSIEWARVEPNPGEFSETAIEHYRQMLKCCHENHLKPFVTLHHFSSPQWLIRQGGWCSDKTPGYFARYASIIAQELGQLIEGMCTINEANIGRVLTSSGMMPPLSQIQASPGWKETADLLDMDPNALMPFMFAVTDQGKDTIMNAHHEAVSAMRGTGLKCPLGITMAVQDIVAGPGGESLAAQHREEVNDVFLRDLAGDDFVGVQCYTRHRFGPDGPLPPEDDVEITQMGYEFWPEALESSIRQAYTSAGIPVLVTEKGLSTTDDSTRIDYVQRALIGVSNCLQDGIPVMGYTYWSAMDNFEWMLGYRPTFGLIAVDRQTQTRTVKESARWLGNISRQNTLSR